MKKLLKEYKMTSYKKISIKSNLSSDMYYRGSGYDGNSILLQITKK